MATGDDERVKGTAESGDSRQERLLFAGGLCSLLLASIPVWRAAGFLFSTGVDVPSNDDVIFLALIDKFCRADYQWQNYFQDTFINGHCFAVGQALFWSNALLTRCSQTSMIAQALLLLCLRLVLLTDYLLAQYSLRIKALVLPIFSLLLWAPSQTAVLAHPTFALAWQLSLLANVLSLSILQKWGHSTAGRIGSAITAIAGCWTTGLSLPVLPFLFVQNYLSGARRAKDYLWLSTATLIALAPYLAALTKRHDNTRSIGEQFSGFNTELFLNCLGRPFANSIGAHFGYLQAAHNAALLGIVSLLLLIILAVFCADRKRLRSHLAPGAICTAMGLLSVALVSAFRPFVAPTYSSISTIFWCGLAGMALYCLVFAAKYKALTRTLSFLILASIVVSTIACSRKFEDKQYYLDNRAPMCASLLQHYSQAPTYATRLLFKLKDLPPYTLALPLERHGWSIFAPHRQYFLQGDFALPAVSLQGKDNSQIFWSADETSDRQESWKVYHHLNLVLKGNCAVDWTVEIPADCTEASLHCALLKGPAENSSLANHIVLNPGTGTESSIKGEACKDGIDLKKFAGQSLVIRFFNRRDRECVLQYPLIDLIAASGPAQSNQPYRPANVSGADRYNTKNGAVLEKIDAQRLSVKPEPSMTCQQFQGLDFLATGKAGTVNCVVKFKNGSAQVLEIPLIENGKTSLYSQPGRLFDDCMEPIAEVSIVNSSPGVLSDFVTAGCLKYR